MCAFEAGGNRQLLQKCIMDRRPQGAECQCRERIRSLYVIRTVCAAWQRIYTVAK